MHNTLLIELDLVFRRSPDPDDDASLPDIEFVDMEPVDHTVVVGVRPLEATALIPVAPYDLVGVAPLTAVAVSGIGVVRPFEVRPARLSPEDLPTEEYYRDGVDAAHF